MSPHVFSIPLLAFLLTGSVAQASEDFFPIGLFEAGTYFSSARLYPDPAQPCRGPNADLEFNSPEWSNLDEVRGDLPGQSTYGYTSGFNVVLDYFYRAENGEVTFDDVQGFLDAAREQNLKALIVLPGYNSGVPPVTQRHYFQQQSPDYSAADSLIREFQQDSAVYGWYLVDEPINIVKPSACVTSLGDTTDPFHSTVVSAQRLKAAYQVLRGTDSMRPFGFTLPDYDDGLFTTKWGARRSGDFWRWDSCSCTNSDTLQYAPFYDQCHDDPTHPIWMTEDYSASADFIMNDTYINAGYGSILQNASWVSRLRQLDEMTLRGEAQMVLAFQGCTSEVTADCPDMDATPGCGRFSFEDLRYQAYSSIIHGARGLWFWSYANTYDPCDGRNPCVRYVGPSEYFVETVVPLSSELDSLDVYFLADELGRFTWGDSVGLCPGVKDANGVEEPRIQLTLRTLNGQVLMIAVNVDSASVNVKFDFGGMPVNSQTRVIHEAVAATRLFPKPGETASAPIGDHMLSDTFAPFEVRIYRFRQIGFPGAAGSRVSASVR